MDRIALVTGAGSGIGRAVARELLEAGWSVLLAGRRREALEETAGDDERATVVPTDVADPAQVAALFAGLDRLDLLFNNAGLFGLSGPLDELETGAWQHVVDVNLTGSFLCAQAAFRIMKRQDPRGGRIVNNGSISAQVPRPNAVAYTATKHAITGLTKAIALEGREHDIACGQIDVGNAATDMTAAMAHGVPQADGSIAAEARMDVRHTAEAVAWMASLPLSANVQFLTILATKMPFVGRG
jgi:NAD(P)-dependent dehydrogenase (short-subunit alcohol dehydrogenase family)